MQKFILFFIFSIVFSQTEYPSVNAFFCSKRLSLAGSGYLLPSIISLKSNPSVFDTNRIFEAGIINYKNGISSQSFGSSFSLFDGSISLVVRNLSYGIFDSYDENKNFLKTYSSSDNFLAFSYGKKVKKLPIKIGLSYKYLYSSLSDISIKKHFITLGSNLLIKKIKTSLGFSIHQIELNKNANSFFETDFVFSILKTLEYLPLKIYLDLILNENSSDIEFFIGGKFNISKDIDLYIGTSSRKITQNIQNNLFYTIFGSSGIGINYNKYPYSINIGTYMYGTGFLINGIQFKILF